MAFDYKCVGVFAISILIYNYHLSSVKYILHYHSKNVAFIYKTCKTCMQAREYEFY